VDIEKLTCLATILGELRDDPARTEALRYNQGSYNAMIATALIGEPVLVGPEEGPKILTWWHNVVGHQKAPNFLGSIDEALRWVPDNWFVERLGELVTPQNRAGDRHFPTGLFRAELQSRDGGRLTTFDGCTLTVAIVGAVVGVELRKFSEGFEL
jgi:hypothetical protein